MSPIASYVFFDIETTGLPQQENNKTRITEISFVAVKREHVLLGSEPRVQHKLTICLNPGMVVQPGSTQVTGLCNDLLENEPRFTEKVCTIIETFLDLLTKPICLIAHNGHGFDFPILKNHLVKQGVSLADDLMCADCLYGFFDILETPKIYNDSSSSSSSSNVESTDEDTGSNRNKREIDETNFFSDSNLKPRWWANENTPKRMKTDINRDTVSPLPISRARRNIYWNKETRSGVKPDKSYKLKDVYCRLLNVEPADAHRAETDCLLALKCSVHLGEAFVQWVDENHCLFSEVKPMTTGRRLGF